MTVSLKLLRTTAFRLSLLYVAIFGAAGAAVIAYTYWNAQTLVSRQIDSTIEAELRGLAEQYAVGGLQRLSQTIAERSATPGNSLYLLTDEKAGRVVGNLRTVSPELWNALGQVEFAYRRPGGGGFEDRMAIVSVVRLQGGFRLIVGRDVEERREFAGLIRSAALWGLATLLITGVGVGLFVGRRLLQRIENLTRQSHGIMAAGMIGRVALDGSGDEIDRLAANLNGMFDRIERLMQGLREVSDNIAHDLKTPLNRLRNRAEAALREGGNAQHYEEALRDTIEEGDELIRTFDALLNIAHMEAGARSVSGAEFDLCAVARDAAELYEPVAEAHGLSITVTGAPVMPITGERQLIAQAIANLLDNAIKYGAPHASSETRGIALDIAQQGPKVEIAISDHGAGIAPGQRGKALERFVRLEASRSKPGSGLGLSLVAAVARLHGGDVRLEDNNPGLKVVFSVCGVNTDAEQSQNSEAIIAKEHEMNPAISVTT